VIRSLVVEPALARKKLASPGSIGRLTLLGEADFAERVAAEHHPAAGAVVHGELQDTVAPLHPQVGVPRPVLVQLRRARFVPAHVALPDSRLNDIGTYSGPVVERGAR
jgi:hypothetical protein